MKQLLTWLPQGGFDLANALDIALPRIKALGYDTVIVTGKRLGGTIPIEIIMIE